MNQGAVEGQELRKGYGEKMMENQQWDLTTTRERWKCDVSNDRSICCILSYVILQIALANEWRAEQEPWLQL
jgi:hypothetical protein